jgi:hypothetical protein
MNTKDQLTETLKRALRDRDERLKRTVRLALAAIKNTEIDSRTELDEPAVLAILQKEIKTRRETIEGAEKARREDLISEAQAEIKILENFLPKPLSEEELTNLAQEVIAQVGATSPRDMGKVMQIIMPQVAGRADGKQISQTVQKLLNQ